MGACGAGFVIKYQLPGKSGRRCRVKQTLVFIIFVLAVVGVLYSISGDRSPRIPDNEAHRVVDSNAICMGCHAPGMEHARKPNHPPKDDCIYCHKTKRFRNIK